MFHPGRPLSAIERSLCQPYFKAETLDKARIVHGHVPFWLHKRMCAVVLGHRIFMRKSAYSLASTPTIIDMRLLAHELTHVEQYLSGMTVIKYLWASRHGYLHNPYEIEAYAKGNYVALQVGDQLQKLV